MRNCKGSSRRPLVLFLCSTIGLKIMHGLPLVMVLLIIAGVGSGGNIIEVHVALSSTLLEQSKSLLEQDWIIRNIFAGNLTHSQLIDHSVDAVEWIGNASWGF